MSHVTAGKGCHCLTSTLTGTHASAQRERKWSVAMMAAIVEVVEAEFEGWWMANSALELAAECRGLSRRVECLLSAKCLRRLPPARPKVNSPALQKDL